MKLPRLSGTRPTEDIMISFKGYNCTEQAGKGEFADMENMTGERFPLLAPRRARGTVQEIGKANGLMAREKLLWVDGTAVFYGGEKIQHGGRQFWRDREPSDRAGGKLEANLPDGDGAGR